MSATAKRDDIEEFLKGENAPRAAEAEKALIGMALADAHTLDLAEGLQAEHFYTPLWGRLWGALSQRHAAGQITDTAILADLFAGDEAFRAQAGKEGLEALIDLAPGASRAPAYADAVRQVAGRRALLRLSLEIGAKAMDDENGTVSAVLAEFEQKAALIGQTADIADAWLKPHEMISGAVLRAQERKGVLDYPLGIPDVDRLLGGLHREEVTLLAARPGMGKTVAGMAYAKSVARSGRLCLFFALEMGADPMAIRLACDLAYDRDRPRYLGVSSNITMERIDRNELAPDEWERLDVARREVARWPLRFDTRAGLTIERIEALARRAFTKAQRAGVEPGAVVIDHLGKVRPSKDRRGNMHAEMADRSAAAADMAKRLGVPVLALMQLSRGVESQEDKQPQLHHLRQAGELEEDARQVVMLYRPEYYLRPPPTGESFDAKAERETKLEQVRNKLFFNVEKNSHGPRGQALTFCEIAASAVREWRS